MFTRRLELATLGAFAFTGLAGGLLHGPEEPAKAAAAPPRRLPNSGIPNVTLTTHTGKKVRFYDDLVRDKLVLVTMMYAACNNTCPPSTFNLVQVQQMLGNRVGRDIFMYSLTLKPEQDSPADLAHYAKLHKVGPGWLFLTGEPADVERLRYALGFYDPDPEVDRKDGRHVGMVRIGNDPYKRWGMAPTLADPRQIVTMIDHLDRKPPPRAA
jgi:protein SCO1/2